MTWEIALDELIYSLSLVLRDPQDRIEDGCPEDMDELLVVMTEDRIRTLKSARQYIRNAFGEEG